MRRAVMPNHPGMACGQLGVCWRRDGRCDRLGDDLLTGIRRSVYP